MTTYANTCQCGRPISDTGRLCWTCTRDLELHLAELPALLGEIQTTRLRQANTGSGTGSRATVEGYDQLPDSRPDERLDELRTHLAGWARIVVEGTGAAWPADTVAAVSRFLFGHLTYLRGHEAAWEAHSDICGAIRRLRQTLDRPAERIYAGPCGAELEVGRCPEHLSTTRGARRITCRGCGAVYDSAAQQQWCLEAAEDQLAHASLLARAVSNLGKPLRVTTVWKWASRGLIVDHGCDPDGRPLYRVGDALDLLASEAARRARVEKREAS